MIHISLIIPITPISLVRLKSYSALGSRNSIVAPLH